MESKDLKDIHALAGQNRVHMQAGIIDQLNANQQSNVTLSAYSIVTQTCSSVKISNA